MFLSAVLSLELIFLLSLLSDTIQDIFFNNYFFYIIIILNIIDINTTFEVTITVFAKPLQNQFVCVYLCLFSTSQIHLIHFDCLIFFESACKARRILAMLCIGFLDNHRLCKHPQNQLVRVYQCLFTTFQIIFLCT